MDFSGPLFRALHPHHARKPLSGEGTRRYGGRFNRQGREALCLACDFDTLRYEIARGGAFQPSVIVEFEAEISGLADGRDLATLARFGLTPGDLAEALIAAGHVGLAVPSFAKGASRAGVNIILWNWGDGTSAQLTPVDDEGRLTRDPGR